MGACALTGPSNSEKHQAQNLFQAGIGFYESKQYPQSLQAFQGAWELDSKNVAYKMHYALALNSVGKTDKSLQILEEACKESRNPYPECENNLSALLIRSGRYEQALTAAEKALSIATYASPETALRNKGLSLYFLQRYSEAEIVLLQSLGPHGGNGSCLTRMYLSRSTLAMARFKDALREARLARNICENRGDTHFWLAYTLYKSAQIAEAIAVLAELRDQSRDPETRAQAQKMISQLNREEPLAEPAIIL